MSTIVFVSMAALTAAHICIMVLMGKVLSSDVKVKDDNILVDFSDETGEKEEIKLLKSSLKTPFNIVMAVIIVIGYAIALTDSMLFSF